MYTQCPECDTVYRITSEDLRQAAGQVECGSCGSHFNALDSLSERPSSHRVVRGAGGTESAAAAAGTEAAEDAEGIAGQGDTAVESLADAGAGPGEPAPAQSDAEEGDVLPAEEDSILPGEQEDRLAPGDDEPTIVEGAEPPEFEDTRTDIWDTGEWRAASPAVFPVLDEEAEDARWAEGLESIGEEAEAAAAGEEPGTSLGEEPAAEASADSVGTPGELVAARRRRWPAWLFAGLLVLATVLALVHARRGELARDPGAAELLEPVYSALGMSLRPAWSLPDLKVLDSAVNMTADGLAVQVAFVNEAAYPQPYPVLRVTLQDRWDQPLATEDLAPRDYLADYAGGLRLGPGEEVRGRALLRSPASEAVGFSVDLCLEAPDRALRCRSAGR